MARKFGGKYSPDGGGSEVKARETSSYRGATVAPAGARANLMFVPAAVVLFTSLTSGATGLALGVVSAAVLALSAWLLRDGLKAEAAYNTRKVARRPGIPRKLFSSVLAGLGIAVAAYKVEPGLVAPVIFGVVTTALHVFSFGMDPMKDKGMEGVDRLQTDRVARVVDQAETYLSAMSDAIRRAGDRTAEARLERFQVSVRDMLRTVEDDPRDLTATRKYLGVYLMGARDATVKFADIQSRAPDPKAKADYLDLLGDLEANFEAKTKTLLADNNSDLEIEIEVLRDRLAREGIRYDTTREFQEGR
ncbi:MULTISPECIES: 5-bromo-4-chloroindolyl phosphate hydrolysis family protein [unclassified Roseovarius]|uniref:5-bromo-4-chloroindolyl phosphate hydrolysis family protein n=1 Tax=unclassified Roseovarius TaxID=2614913 RepID=UPI00273D475E|nr:5-bromo-4-chloroindolyl phosphate hydrolysis family protein [Roseovarius sp. MMSF_3350]